MQRRRTAEDQLQMRSFFVEDDVVNKLPTRDTLVRHLGWLSRCAPKCSRLMEMVALLYTHAVNGITLAIIAEGLNHVGCSYGKVTGGLFVKALSTLIKRSAQHIHSLPCGINAIFGNNGYIWISPSAESEDGKEKEAAGKAKEKFERVARVRNAIIVLAKQFMLISAQSVMSVYDASLQAGLEPKVKNCLLLMDALCVW